MSTAGEPITAEGLKALERELDDLQTRGRRELAARILAARELGDLKENAEYHAAKEDQAHLETRILRLRQRLRNAVVTEAPGQTDAIAFDGAFVVRDEATGQEHSWRIVGAPEADVGTGRLSVESPVAQALLGHRPDDVVEVPTPRGSRRLRILRLLDA